MKYNFNQCNLGNIQIGGKQNVMNNAPTNSYRFLNESKKYISKRDDVSLKSLIKEHSHEFLKNIFYNITSAEFIKLLAKIGIFI